MCLRGDGCGRPWLAAAAGTCLSHLAELVISMSDWQRQARQTECVPLHGSHHRADEDGIVRQSSCCSWSSISSSSSSISTLAVWRRTDSWVTPIYAPVMGKSHSRLGFSSRFEHIWRIDLNYKDSLQKTAVWFEICFTIFEIWFEIKLNRDKSAASYRLKTEGVIV